MDAFESVIATLIEQEGFWVRTSLKVELTKQEKVDIKRKTSPRWELDVVGYRPADNVLRVIECKSYLNSTGVRAQGFRPGGKTQSRYKLFNEHQTRAVIFDRLIAQLLEAKSIQGNPTVEFGLAAGNIYPADREWIAEHFDANGWLLYDLSWIQERLRLLCQGGYQNDVVAVAVKLLRGTT